MIKCRGKDKIQCIFLNYSRLVVDNYVKLTHISDFNVDIKDIYVK